LTSEGNDFLFCQFVQFLYFCSMKKYGLIGKKLGHSWSKKWFEEMFSREDIRDAEYRLYEMPSVEGLHQWVTQEDLIGFNVTIPYKEEVIPLLDQLDEVAASIGAVNCVEVRDGRLIGHNTDAPAFSQTLQPLLKPWHTQSHALILGTGGASKAVAYALRQLGITYALVSRTPQDHPSAISYDEALKLAKNNYLIINCTPAGMYPDIDATPWPDASILSDKHLCYDLIYNPLKTRFLHEAESYGATITNGLAMLERQAQLSWHLWRHNP